MSTDNLQNSELNSLEVDVQAKQIAGLLDAHAKRLSMRTLKQLEDGRARALKVHAQQISGASVNKDGTLNNFFSWADHHRIASMGVLLALLIAGFIAMQSLNRETSDAFLLGADLPPEAFVDRGFEPFLNDGQAKL